VLLIALKLADTLSRALFVVLASYSLKVDQAGQFGITTTLIGLFAFAVGFERHLDIQRRNAGVTPDVMDHAIASAMRFHGFNLAIASPVFIMGLAHWSKLGPWPLALCQVIVITEYLSNQAYQASLISRRYVHLVSVVAIKNIALVTCLGGYILLRGQPDIQSVLTLWAASASILICLGFPLVWVLQIRRPADLAPPRPLRPIFEQHKASATHFGIGLLATITLQLDRITVGGLLSLEQVGSYFRHALIASFCYQAFNIVSFNRLLPRLFEAAPRSTTNILRRMVNREYLLTLIGAPVFLVIVWAADTVTQGVYSRKFHLSFTVLALLVLAFMSRAAADFQGLILHARLKEHRVLLAQALAFVVGLISLLGLAKFGPPGVAAASILTGLSYFAISNHFVRQLSQ